MELDYIKDFIMMAKYEDLCETAEHLFISQSTLSRHIKSIEDYLNVQLFERSSRNMILNKYGEIFLKYALQMVQLDEACKRALLEEEEQNGDVLHLATLGTSNGYCILDVIEKFQKEHPEYQICIHESDTEENWERLRRMECDFAFVLERKEEHMGVKRIRFATDALVAVLPADHVMASNSAVNAYLLKGEPLLLFDKSSYIHKLCLRIFEKDNIRPKIMVTGFRSENLIDLVDKQMGIALMMRKEAEEYAGDNMNILLFEPEVAVNINMVYRQERTLRKIDLEFLECVQSVLKLSIN